MFHNSKQALTLSSTSVLQACGCAKRLEQFSDFLRHEPSKPCMVSLFLVFATSHFPRSHQVSLPSSTSTFAINLQTRCRSTRSYLTCSTLRPAAAYQRCLAQARPSMSPDSVMVLALETWPTNSNAMADSSDVTSQLLAQQPAVCELA